MKLKNCPGCKLAKQLYYFKGGGQPSKPAKRDEKGKVVEVGAPSTMQPYRAACVDCIKTFPGAKPGPRVVVRDTILNVTGSNPTGET